MSLGYQQTRMRPAVGRRPDSALAPPTTGYAVRSGSWVDSRHSG